MKDTLVKALAHQGRIRIMAVNTKESVNHLVTLFDLYPTSAAALGRFISIGYIMGGMLKAKEESISATLKGSNEIKQLVMVAKSDGTLKATISNPHVTMVNSLTGKLDVGGAIGPGTLSVVKNFGLKNNFASTVNLTTSEIGDDFTTYFATSEQTPSAISVGVLVNEDGSVASAGALCIQLMPGHDEADILMVEHVLENLKPISTILSEDGDVVHLVNALFDDTTILETKEVSYACDCSYERMRKGLSLIDMVDLKDIIREDQEAHIECQFCREEYHFTLEALLEIKKEKEAVHEHRIH
jgi:molecular chaperone Hsp33